MLVNSWRSLRSLQSKEQRELQNAVVTLLLSKGWKCYPRVIWIAGGKPGVVYCSDPASQYVTISFFPVLRGVTCNITGSILFIFPCRDPKRFCWTQLSCRVTLCFTDFSRAFWTTEFQHSVNPWIFQYKKMRQSFQSIYGTVELFSWKQAVFSDVNAGSTPRHLLYLMLLRIVHLVLCLEILAALCLLKKIDKWNAVKDCSPQ